MFEDDGSDLIDSILKGFVIGWLILGFLRLIWWLLKGMWLVVRFVYNFIRGRRHLSRVASLQRAWALEAEGRVDEAVDMYRALVEVPDASVAEVAAYSLGSLLKQAERWDEAAMMYQRAMASRDPELLPLATLGLGDALYFGLSDATAAEPIYRHLLRPSSQTLDGIPSRISFVFLTTSSLVDLLCSRKEYEEAETLCRQMVDDKAMSAGDRLGATVGLARILTKQGKAEEAVGLFRRVRTTGEDDLAALRSIGCPLFRVQSLEELVQEINSRKGPGLRSA